jgi:hypothetical protein
MPQLTTSTYRSRKATASNLKVYFDPTIIVKPTVSEIRERNGLGPIPSSARTILAERGNTMPAITETHYGQGRGKKAKDAELSADTVAFFTDADNLATVKRGVYVDLMANDFTGPKTKVGEALIAALNLDPEAWSAPTKAPINDGAEVAVTLRAVKAPEADTEA